MRGSLFALRARPLPSAIDWTFAAALAAVGVQDVMRGLTTDPAAGVVVTVILFAPLAVRRRFPVTVLITVFAASLLLLLVLADRDVNNPLGLEHFSAWLVVSYSVAAYAQGRRYVVALASAVAAGGIWAGVSLASGEPAGDVVPGVLLCVVMWLVGRMIQRRELMVRLLREHAQQLERERGFRENAAAADERTRIARELHDVVAHGVSVIVVQAQAGQRLLSDPEQVRGALRSIEGTGRDALVELRRLLGILRSEDESGATLGPQPDLGELQALIDHVRQAGLPVTLRIEGEPVLLPAGVNLSAYRIVQEALTNTLKHAGDAEAQVVLRYHPRLLQIEVTDSGGGNRRASGEPGHGLAGMRERVALHRGSVHAAPCDAGGYAVLADLPLVGGDR